MSRGRISKRSVDALACPSGRDREFLWDSAIAGFGVAAFPARSEAKKLLGVAESGSDPIAARKAARDVRTFGAVANDFLSLHVATKRKACTIAEYRRTLCSNVTPAIGQKRIIELRRADVAKLHAKLVDTPYEANRALALVSAVWNWAARRDEVTASANPCVGIERYPECGRERFLTSEELGRLGAALVEGGSIGLPYLVDTEKPSAKHAPKESNRRTLTDPHAVAAIRLLILTGARLLCMRVGGMWISNEA